MDTLIPINIVVGDRSYRIRIDPKNEEVVRRTIKIINDKIVEYKTDFAGKDMQDYISMVVMWYATNATGGDSMSTELTDKMNSLETMLDKALLK